MHAFIAMIATQALAFFLLYLILKLFAFKPVLGAIDSRRDYIADQFEEISRGKTEVMKTQREYEGRLSQVEDEARIRIRDAIQEGQQLAEQIKSEAQSEAHALIEKTQALLESERAKAAVELRDQVVDLTLQATEKLIRERLDDAKHRELIADFIENLPTVRT